MGEGERRCYVPPAIKPCSMPTVTTSIIWVRIRDNEAQVSLLGSSTSTVRVQLHTVRCERLVFLAETKPSPSPSPSSDVVFVFGDSILIIRHEHEHEHEHNFPIPELASEQPSLLCAGARAFINQSTNRQTHQPALPTPDS